VQPPEEQVQRAEASLVAVDDILKLLASQGGPISFFPLLLADSGLSLKFRAEFDDKVTYVYSGPGLESVTCQASQLDGEGKT
jgi:hypothetical protein